MLFANTNQFWHGMCYMNVGHETVHVKSPTTIKPIHNYTMKPLFKLSALAALTTSALAGAVETSSTSPASAEPWIMGSVSAGYDSSYYFRGLWFSNNNFWGGVNLSAPVADKLTLGFSALYTETTFTDLTANSNDLDYNELDLIGSLSYETDFATFGLVVTNYHFFDTFSGSINNVPNGNGSYDSTVKNALDIGLTMVKPLGDFNLYLGSWFDTKIDGWYFEAGLDYTYEVNEKLSIVPVVQMGYAIDYYTMDFSDNEGLTHVRAAISAPYQATDSLSVTPYFAYNFPLETRKNLNTNETRNDPYAGVAVSYSF